MNKCTFSRRDFIRLSGVLAGASLLSACAPIEEMVITAMEKKYPVAPERVLWGHSAGGNFGLYSMFKKPGLFQYIHASSPYLGPDSPLPQVEAQAAETKPTIPTSLLLSMGTLEGDENVKATEDFGNLLKERGYPELEVQYIEIENENHVTVAIPAMQNGLPILIPALTEASFLDKSTTLSYRCSALFRNT